MEEQKKQEEEQREAILNAVCTGEARARLNRVSLVNPEKARAVENQLIALAQQRALPGKVSDQQVVNMLEQRTQKSGAVKVMRRKGFDSDEDDLDESF